MIAAVHPQVLALRHHVLAFDPAVAAHDDRALAAPLVADLDHALDLREHGRVLRASRLEQLGDARQTAGDVLRALDLARRLREQRAGLDLLPFLDLDVGLLGQRVNRGTLAVLVLDDDLRVQLALVLDDDLARDARLRVLLELHRLALEDILEADDAADLGEDRIVVRVPLDEHRARHDFLTVLDAQDRADLDRVAVAGVRVGEHLVHHHDLALALQDNALAVLLLDELEVGEADDAAALGLDLGLLDLLRGGATDVERPHRELRAGLADRLRRDDADGQALLRDLVAGQVHAIAQRAHAE